MRLYPVGGSPWRRVLFPVAGSLGIGYLLFRYFPNARGSGVPQTKAALFAREGRITLRTVFGKFFCTSATLASGIPLGREGPSVQVARRHRLRARTAPRTAHRASQEPDSCWSRGRHRGRIQYASGRCVVCPRGDHGRSPRTCDGRGGARLGDCVDGPAGPSRQPSSLQGSAISTGPSHGICGLCGARRGWRTGFRGLHQALAGIRARFLRFPQKTVWFQPVVGGLLVGVMGMVCAPGSRRRLRVCGRRAEREHGVQNDAGAGRPETCRRHHQLCFGQCWRYFWSLSVHRRHVGRIGRDAGAYFFPPTPRRQAPTRWSEWARSSRASCALP